MLADAEVLRQAVSIRRAVVIRDGRRDERPHGHEQRREAKLKEERKLTSVV